MAIVHVREWIHPWLSCTCVNGYIATEGKKSSITCAFSIMCIHACMHTYIHACIYALVRIHAHKHMQTQLDTCTHTNTHDKTSLNTLACAQSRLNNQPGQALRHAFHHSRCSHIVLTVAGRHVLGRAGGEGGVT
jgi:hypothetical protein